MSNPENNKPAKIKKISDKTKLAVMERYFTRMHFHRYVTGDEARIGKMILAADGLIHAQAVRGTEAEITTAYNVAFEKFRQAIDE